MATLSYNGFFCDMPAELPETGEINDEVIAVFTRGHCHSFALAMHQETGWPVFGIGKGMWSNDTPGHCVVYCPQLDDYIDINGPGARERCANMFERNIEPLGPEQLGNMRNYRPTEAEEARRFVKTVLQNLPTEPVHKKVELGTKDSLTL